MDGKNCQGVVEDSLAEAIKENASVVGSSLTECKHDIEKCDGVESSINPDNDEHDAGTEEQLHSSGEVVGTSPLENDKLHTRYFVIKSLSHDNIQMSFEKGIWATQVMNEPILEEAFHNSDRVILIFSVNMSGFFQGYAQMMSSVGWRRDNVWSKSTGGSNPWGRTFKVKWLRLCDLPFKKTLHLKNPLNEHKPVKISRDCQELSADIGEALCGLFDAEAEMKGNLKRNNSFMNDVLLKRPCRSSPVHFEDDDSLLSLSSSHIRWSGGTLHPSLFYQHVDHTHHVLERSPRVSFLHPTHPYLEPESALCMKQQFISRSLNNRQGGRKDFLQSNKNDASHEGNLAVSLSDEDILDMTYEDYLQAMARASCSSHRASSSVGTARNHQVFADK